MEPPQRGGTPRWENGTNVNSIIDEQDDMEDDLESNSAKLFERSRIKALADERESVQKKTFTKWVNSHLSRVGCKIQDLYVDLRDGKMLIKLLEVLSGERLPNPTKGKMRIHCLENVDKSLTFLNEQRVHLENMGAHDIVDGNPRLTLGLIWTIILRFQIQDITVEQVDSSEIKSAKDALLLWCQMKTAGYANVNVRNFTTSWRDGLAFNALIHKHRPDLIEYNKLTKANPTYNLNNSFNVAEDKLGLTRLLDPEDVAVEYPDEKSIITYVVTYYHYFSKMKAESVQGRRVGKVLNQCREYDEMIADYETLTSDLLEWIKKTIEILNNREFPNSLVGVQNMLTQFNNYRTLEKPPKFVEKGNLEVLLFTIQSKMRANNQKPYTPREGRMLADINRAWEALEKAEHERELALRDELIRQEKLEQLAARFDRKAGMRETWLSENQRLVSQDNFGYDLAAVEAATKKHEAIETDINAYEERVQAVVAVAQELQNENYNDIERINGRKDNVLELWSYLLELLRARRLRLELSLKLQKVFQEMLYILDWMDEIKVNLQSEEYGKHLMGVEDLLQKHSIIESDIAIVGARVEAINAQAQTFVDTDFPDVGGYKPCSPQLVSDRIVHLTAAYEELLQLANERQSRLKEARKMWQFYDDVEDEEAWIKEKEQIMSSPDLGHDLTSVRLLLTKHKANEDELNSRYSHLPTVLQVGHDLIKADNFGSEKIQNRIDNIEEQWKNLLELANFRRRRLMEAVDFYQFFSDADDVDTWMLDMLRLVSSEDVGHDEASVQSLVKKHKNITEELHSNRTAIDSLHEQASNLGEQDRESPEVRSRLDSVERRYHELLELTELRKQRLLDALALYKLYNDADGVEQWIAEKEKLLHTMVATEDVEEVEILKARFETFDEEMRANADKVEVVNQLSRQLLQNEHPNAEEVITREDQLNKKWSELKEIAERKKEGLQLAHDVNTFHIECQETATWIRDKAKLIESTDELSNDLTGVITLQRRLSGLERDLAAIEAKLDHLQKESERLTEEKPEEAAVVDEKIVTLTVLWQELKQTLKVRDERLGEASELQKFLQNLDHFQQWLTRTETAIASEDIPDDLVEAERLLHDHALLKQEIDTYAPDYAQMKEYGQKVVEGQEGVQYMFLRERLKALDDGWTDLQKMWDTKQSLFTQSNKLLFFMRDAKQAEVLLSQQDNFLSKEETPHSVENAEHLIKRLESFITMTMDANDDRINSVVALGRQLIAENNYASDKIQQKADSLEDRREKNRKRANDQLEKLKDALLLQQFFQDCDELSDWLAEKMLAAQDETYRDAKNIHSKWMRHQAFESEIKSNKDRLERLVKEGNDLIEQKPELAKEIQPRVDELARQWKELEGTTAGKGEKLFDANRHVLYEQSCDDIDGWINEIESQIITDDVGHDLTTVNLLVQKQNILESQLKIKQVQVDELQAQTGLLKDIDPQKEEEIMQKKTRVEERFAKMLEPLIERRAKLERTKRLHQFLRDIEDEKMWIAEKLPQAQSTVYGNSLLSVQMLQKKNKSLQNEVDSHEPRIISVVDLGLSMIEEGHPQSDEFQKLIDDLNTRWAELLAAVQARKDRLELSELTQQYFFDASEAEAWMSEQELYMISEDRARDEMGATNMLKKHSNMERVVEDYADTIRQLGERSRKFLDDGHPDSDAIAVKQSQVDKLYASLKDLALERRDKLGEVLKLYKLNREIEDLEQWIAEREVVAGSHELGQDFEHVTMLCDRFKEFAHETEMIGQERVAAVNDICDQLIAAGHSDAATIAEWKDGINEAWTDLLELIDTRTQALAASWELHKFFHDCKETLLRIHDKQLTIPDDPGKDGQSVAALQRRLANFEHDLLNLGTQVQGIQEEAAKLIVAYSGEKARDIQQHEMEVVNAWRNLQIHLEQRKGRLGDSSDLYRFFGMVRDLLNWMSDMTRQMSTQEKPRDVSGVELLMNNHQGLKAEIDARAENFTICVNLGKDLIHRRHPRSQEVKDRLQQLAMQRGGMMEQWEEGWEYLQLILEVYQFARDASVAEAWLMAHEPYLSSQEYGDTLDAVETLLKKHEAFERAAATQEERFLALERITTLELRDRKKRQQAEFEAQHPDAKPSKKKTYTDKYLEEFLPPPEPEPVAEPAATPEVEAELQVEDAPDVAAQRSRDKPTDEVAKVKLAEVARSATMPKKSDTAKPGAAVKRTESTPAGKRAAEAAAAAPSGALEGMLSRKHEWESTTKKSNARGWDKLYVVLTTDSLLFYKDQKHAKADPNTMHRPQIQLAGVSALAATDYIKKPNVFRLKLGSGAEYLFNARDEDEMNNWIERINAAAGSDAASSLSRAQTMPASSEGRREEPKRRSFFTLGKKKGEKDSA